MNGKYHNRYRIASARLATWNYGWQAIYFVTICTAEREHFFGTISDGVMFISDLGRVAENEWVKTLSVRPDMNLELDAFCVMPNHFHGIIAIGDNEYNARRRDAMHGVSTGAATGNRFGPQSKKSGVDHAWI